MSLEVLAFVPHPIASASGPRHMAFHPDRQHAYVLSELASSVTVFDYDPVRAAFTWKQTISTLPARPPLTAKMAENFLLPYRVP